MPGTITKIIGRFLVVYGFIVTALTISGIVEINEIKDIQQFANAIFNTNCMLLGNCFFFIESKFILNLFADLYIWIGFTFCSCCIANSILQNIFDDICINKYNFLIIDKV